MGSFQFDCEFCEATVEGTTTAAIKDHAQTHLHSHHESELLDAFRDTISGADYTNACGYGFPVAGREIAGFDCPTCGQDHFPKFAQQYLYWRIERR